jgi:predicted transposase/invertase (TIGR01784 family)
VGLAAVSARKNQGGIRSDSQKNPEIRKAVNTLYELSADATVRAEYERHQKAWRDRISGFEGARKEGEQNKAIEVARTMKAAGEDAHKIATYTGLAVGEIETL